MCYRVHSLLLLSAFQIIASISETDITKHFFLITLPTPARSFNGDVTTFDVRTVYDFRKMFLDAKDFNQDISTWQFGSTRLPQDIRFEEFLNGALAFNQDLSAWKFEFVYRTGVNTVKSMFRHTNMNRQLCGKSWIDTLNDDTIDKTNMFEGTTGGIVSDYTEMCCSQGTSVDVNECKSCSIGLYKATEWSARPFNCLKCVSGKYT